MLSPQLRRKVHDLWSLFWSSGLSNPLVAIEQITYLLFIRQLEKLDGERVKQGKASLYLLTTNEQAQRKRLVADIKKEDPSLNDADIEDRISIPVDYHRCKWSFISETAKLDVPFLADFVFPWLRTLESRIGDGEEVAQVSRRLTDAYFILDRNKTETLIRSVKIIDELFRQLDTRSVNSDIMGDIFEYLLEEVKESGKNGQFRTPRHVIRFMVELMDPPLGANSIFYGDKLLTTANPRANEDMKLLEELGLLPQSPNPGMAAPVADSARPLMPCKVETES